uniref:Uncharacterized protein n=1 Tax=Setaria italica TaxID=4555 RepID=K4ANC6_SETIT
MGYYFQSRSFSGNHTCTLKLITFCNEGTSHSQIMKKPMAPIQRVRVS